MCHALIGKDEIQAEHTEELINKMYDGQSDKLFAALLGNKRLSSAQIQRLKDIVSEMELDE